MGEQLVDFDNYLASVTREVENIKVQVEERKQIYQKCLQNFKHHLQGQTELLDKTNLKAQQKNNLIRQEFEHIYNTINQNSDNMLRLIRKTYQTKSRFWKETINDYVDETDLELKRELHQAKKNADESYYQAIDERKIQPIPYNKLVMVSERDKALTNFQESNRKFQINVYTGTMMQMTRGERKSYLQDKENTMVENWGVRMEQEDSRKIDTAGILGRFMKQ